MVILVLLVAVIGLLCYGFYAWARKQGLAGGEARQSQAAATGTYSSARLGTLAETLS